MSRVKAQNHTEVSNLQIQGFLEYEIYDILFWNNYGIFLSQFGSLLDVERSRISAGESKK
jgi:hypothetical protein